MELYKVRGGNKESLKQKQYTIGVGISLGNKWFTLENIVELTKWSLAHTKDKVIVYVADSIHAINLEVRNKTSFEKASLLANKMGDKVLCEVKEELEKQLTTEDKKRIVYVKWQDLIDNAFQKKLDYLYNSYNTNDHFKDTVHSIIKDFTSKEVRHFSDKDIHRLGEYILEEMPEILNRVSMGGIICDAYAYPYDGKLPEFIEQLQYGKIFPEIKEEVMDTEPKVFLEVR